MTRTICNLRAALRVAFLSVIFLFMACGGQNNAHGQTCGSDYVIKEGESLAEIASRVYGTTSQWTIIFYANQDRLGANASLLVPGLSIKIPCISQPPQERLPEAAMARAGPSKPARFELSSLVKRIDFLTADGFAPFTGRSLANGGMLTHALSASMNLIKEQAKGGFDFRVSWVNDWGAHINPLLTSRAFDLGFPWTKPDCENFLELDQDAKYRCQKFFFSDPLYEVLTVLFVQKNSPITFSSDDELLGKKICQPTGTSTYELDKGGRTWVKDSKITLMRPQTIDECFRLLDSGTVDAVVASDLTGRATITALGMTDRIRMIERPVAIGTLHVIVAKTHPHARTLLYYVNDSLTKLRESGEYDRISESHLSQFWEAQDMDKKPVSGNTPNSSASKP